MGFILSEMLQEFRQHYKPSPRVAVVDSFLLFLGLTAFVQLAYAIQVGSFPFNSFLSGFISAIGTFVFTVGLRMQLSEENAKRESLPFQPERAFADWLLCNIIFHLVVFNFLG